MANRTEIEDQMARVHAAAKEESFSGDLRRRIHAAHPKMLLHHFEEAAGITGDELVDFLEGTGQLTTAQVDAICAKLGVKLADTAA
ncbi:MAG: hypothetical protein C0478_09820 [Planctomyces sp.]|nr:hypothetical protein [Planctomyces sp.]